MIPMITMARGGEVTWDVSADLTEMGRTPVMVVCAGAKSVGGGPGPLGLGGGEGVAGAPISSTLPLLAFVSFICCLFFF